MRLYLLRQRREIWTESIFQNQFNNFCRHCVTAKSNLRILQRRFILCQKLTLSINKIGETFVKYQTVSCSCVHNNKENRYYSPIFPCSEGTWPPKRLLGHKCHMLLMTPSPVTHCDVATVTCWWLSSVMTSPRQLSGTNWVVSPLPQWRGPGTRASAPDVWRSGPGPHLRRVITRSGASWSVMEPCHSHTTGRTLTQKWVFPSTRVEAVDKACEDWYNMIHGNLDKKRTR